MNEKKDDSEGRKNNISDTVELLESLFSDTKDSRIKLVRRKARPKSRMKKRVVSKKRKESVEKGSKIKPNSVQRSTADTRPTPTIGKDDSEKISKTDVLKKKRGPSMTSAGVTEDKGAIPETAEIFFDGVDQKGDASADHAGLAKADEEITEVLDKSALSAMISSLESSGEEAQQRWAADERAVPEDEEGEAEIVFDGVDQKGGVSTDHGGLAEADEEITEVLDESVLSAMISSLESSGEEAQRILSAEEGSTPEDEKEGIETVVEVSAPEERPSVFSRIGGLGKEGFVTQEKRAAPTLGPLDDSPAGTGEQDFHHRQAAEDEPIFTDGRSGIQKASRLEKSREDKPADLAERIEELVEEIQSLRTSVRRAMLVRVVLPLVLFTILAVILSIWLMPFDSFKREEAQEMAKEEMAETLELKKPDITPETSSPKKQNTPSESSTDVVAPVEQDVEPTDVAGKKSYKGF